MWKTAGRQFEANEPSRLRDSITQPSPDAAQECTTGEVVLHIYLAGCNCFWCNANAVATALRHRAISRDQTSGDGNSTFVDEPADGRPDPAETYRGV